VEPILAIDFLWPAALPWLVGLVALGAVSGFLVARRSSEPGSGDEALEGAIAALVLGVVLFFPASYFAQGWAADAVAVQAEARYGAVLDRETLAELGYPLAGWGPPDSQWQVYGQAEVEVLRLDGVVLELQLGLVWTGNGFELRESQPQAVLQCVTEDRDDDWCSGWVELSRLQ